jgi:2-succinyl-6-hydroxy-2,4-cyclohexadiene-1-carboxylate synthase
MPTIEVTGAELWYEDTGGDGPPVVFVHPAAADHHTWEQQLPAFVADGYRCITYDLRGWGQSRQKPDATDAGQISTDLEALTRQLGLDRFVLIGAAYGGMGALDYALRFQDRLHAFVLATSQGAIVSPEFSAILDRIVPPALRAIPIELRELGPSYRVEQPAGVERWLQIIHDGGGESAPRQPRYLTLTLDLLETLRVPTLVLAADADLLAPPALMRLIAERIPDSVFATVPDAGHSAHWERPAAWNQAVLGFLANQRLARGPA